jgi:hypothetical protein
MSPSTYAGRQAIHATIVGLPRRHATPAICCAGENGGAESLIFEPKIGVRNFSDYLAANGRRLGQY